MTCAADSYHTELFSTDPADVTRDPMPTSAGRLQARIGLILNEFGKVLKDTDRARRPKTIHHVGDALKRIYGGTLVHKTPLGGETLTVVHVAGCSLQWSDQAHTWICHAPEGVHSGSIFCAASLANAIAAAR